MDLIKKLMYDQKIKSKFLQRVKNGLFEKHQSFLSSPLLATMMLLTFDQFADIPEKMHLFYEQAFDTLFAKHDATEEAYKRKSHTGLPIDVFKKLLSYVCLITYYDEKYEFTETEIINYIEKGVRIIGINVDCEKFLKDLDQSVCILQRDGLVYVFTHRSFQEYFSAYCLCNLMTGQIGEICASFTNRYPDSVIEMCFDMNQPLLEREFIEPVVKVFNDNFSSPKNYVHEYVKFNKCFVLVHGFTGDVDVMLHSLEQSWVHEHTIRRLYSKRFPMILAENDEKELASALLKIDEFEGNIFCVQLDEVKEPPSPTWLGDIGITDEIYKASISKFRNFNLYANTIQWVENFKAIDKDIKKRNERRAKSIETIFKLN